MYAHIQHELNFCQATSSWWVITGTGWLKVAARPEHNCPSADQQRDTDTARDLILFHCLTENGQVLHETDNTANDWSDWVNYRDRSGMQPIIQHLLIGALNEHGTMHD